MFAWFFLASLFLMIAPLAHSAEVEFLPRAFHHAPLEPPDGVLHGAGQDPVAFRDYSRALGPSTRPALFMTYTNLAGSRESIERWGKNLKQELESWDPRSPVPQIGLSMVAGKDTGDGRDALVAEGGCDEQLEVFVEALRALGRPAFIRIGYEFEGPWNGYRPESYKRAFIRIARRLRQAKFDVATVWCSAGASAGNASTVRMLEFYPGDEWVDWWGIDLFAENELSSPVTEEFLSAASHRAKPVMIGESTPRLIGVDRGMDSWNRWFAPYFGLIRRHPGIKAFCYINWEWREWSDRLGFPWHDWGDARIERNAEVLQQYREEIRHAGYLHAHEWP